MHRKERITRRISHSDLHGQFKCMEKPVVGTINRLALTELECAERVGDVLERVHDAMRVVVPGGVGGGEREVATVG